MSRVARRANDASDATRDVVAAQVTRNLGEITWPRVDASGPVEDVLRRIAPLIPSQSSGG
jgi:predicted kinase